MLHALRLKSQFAGFVLVTFVCASLAGQQNSNQISSAKTLIESEKETILFFAHPTATFQSLNFNEAKQLSDGFSLSYTFNWRSELSGADRYTELTFYYDRGGNLDFIQAGSTSSFIRPFFASDQVIELIKQQMQTDADLQNDRQLMKLLQRNSKEVLETYLRRDIGSLMTVVAAIAGKTSTVASQTPAQVAVNKPIIKVLSQDNAEIIALIRKSESMDDKERKYWLDALPKLTEDQRNKLHKILLDGRNQLDAIDNKFSAADAELKQAKALLDQEKYGEATLHLSNVLATDKGNVEALANRGTAYENTKEWKLAIIDFTSLIDVSPKYGYAYRSRAFCYGKLGDYRREYSDFMRALEIDPNNVYACNAVAWRLATCEEAKNRDGAEALTYATKACELTKWDDPYYFDTLAAAYAEIGQFEKASQWQEKALADPRFVKRLSKSDFADANKRLELYKSRQVYRER